MNFKKLSKALFLLTFCFCASAFAQDEKNKPLKIVAKPRASYTDAARTNNVQGTVKVLVVFSADGKIGDVSDVAENSKAARKSGLVAECIRVAKKIKFEPEIKDGKPITITKIIEYNFTLY